MKRLSLLALVAILGLAGCDTIDKRIEKKAEVFNALTPSEQETLRQGRVEVGYTEEMAYIAFGQADEVKEKRTKDGIAKTWIYLSYSEEYEGNRVVGYRRQAFVDRQTGKIYVMHRPVDVPVYSERVEEILRVEFENGKVTALEQPK